MRKRSTAVSGSLLAVRKRYAAASSSLFGTVIGALKRLEPERVLYLAVHNNLQNIFSTRFSQRYDFRK